MGATHALAEQRDIGRGFAALESRRAASKARSTKEIVSFGELYAHALMIAYEAAARYSEFATVMADCGNDTTAGLFCRLAKLEAEHAFQLAKKSEGIEIPIIDPGGYASGEYDWLGHGAPVLEARAFIFRMMTPRLALEIALRAEERATTFFERVRDESPNVRVRALASEFARVEQSHIECVTDALAQLPRVFPTNEDRQGDPTIERSM